MYEKHIGKLRGISFAKCAKKALMYLRENVPCDLTRDPTNKFDKNAIKVWVWRSSWTEEQQASLLAEGATFSHERMFVGHVDAETAAVVAPKMDSVALQPPMDPENIMVRGTLTDDHSPHVVIEFITEKEVGLAPPPPTERIQGPRNEPPPRPALNTEAFPARGKKAKSAAQGNFDF